MAAWFDLIQPRRPPAPRIREDRCHFAILRQRAHQARAFCNQSQAIFETEGAGNTRGDIFANAMAENSVRFNAP
jgi:hypothetical protein